MSWENVLGIDVAKDNLVIYDRLKNNVITIANTVEAIEQAQNNHGWNSDNFLIGLESTGNYSFLPMQYFVRKGFKVKLLNPIVTKKFTKATIRAKKTDRSDAETIANFIFPGACVSVSASKRPRKHRKRFGSSHERKKPTGRKKLLIHISAAAKNYRLLFQLKRAT